MIVAGTGHRPNKVGGYSDEATDKLVVIARSWLREGGWNVNKVITGMALGWDQALGWAAYDLGIPFIAAIPFVDQEKAWPISSQERYEDLLNRAAEKVIVSEGGYNPYKMQVRNEWMVDHCDTVLALWDGSAGGTGNCIKYAEKVGKPIINLWAEYEALA